VLPGKKYRPEDALRILWHHKWLIVVPFAVATIGAGLFARRLPSIYRSETLIQVVPQRIPESYVRSTVTTRIEDRLGGIQQMILSRSRLERIINDFNLYQEERKVMVMEDVVARMRDRDVNVRVERGDAFRVSYIAGDPRIAQKVAERLGSLFIDENLRDREALAEQTSQFLEGQLEDARQRLLTHEKKLEVYRRLHAGELPTQLQGNLQAIQNAQMQLQSLTEAMNRDRERRLLLERQLADFEMTDSIPVPVAAPPPSADPAVAGGSSAEQLEAAITLRRTLLVRFKPDHPDVQALERRIKGLEQKVLAEQGVRTTSEGQAPRVASASEILKQNRMRDLRSNLQTVERDLAVKQESERQLRATIASYQAKANAAPTRESELTELTRDYTTIQNIYTSLLEKREASKLAANVERQQIGEQFKILDPARVPERPFSPNRLMIVAIGAVFGLLPGLALIGFLEYRDSTFKTEADIQRLLQLPVLALVPLMTSEKEVKRQRRRRMAVALGAMVLVIGSAAVALWKLQGF
jgi:polysaccharide chain length determinant protein (PEP-CTERM system associated)